MEAQNNQHETQPASAAKAPVVTSCRKKKSDDATILQDVKDHIDEFIHASMDEHKTCFTKTIKKVCSNFLNPRSYSLCTEINLKHFDFYFFVSDVWNVKGGSWKEF